LGDRNWLASFETFQATLWQPVQGAKDPGTKLSKIKEIICVYIISLYIQPYG
jgi:hypothetical protein